MPVFFGSTVVFVLLIVDPCMKHVDVSSDFDENKYISWFAICQSSNSQELEVCIAGAGHEDIRIFFDEKFR